MWNRIKHWWDAQGELAKLHGISDRMLADLGLERDDLRARVMGEVAKMPQTCACLPAGGLKRA